VRIVFPEEPEFTPPALKPYRPAPGVTWQWQLASSTSHDPKAIYIDDINISYNVEIYDIDLFNSSSTLIQRLHRNGRKVICYFSAGSYEPDRPDTAPAGPGTGQFMAADLGNPLVGYPDEKWLDIRSPNVRRIMVNRLDLAAQKKCDGVEPDNMDGYLNNSGFSLTDKDQLAFNQFIADEAHQRGLSVGLKNDLDQVVALEPYFDFAVNEQCFEYLECDVLQPFITAGKAVLNAEYKARYVKNKNDRNALCKESIKRQFSTLVLPVALDDQFRFSCR